MTSKELRSKFLEYFSSKGHEILPSSSLIPKNDPSVLLTTAGMQQFKKWFSGLEKPAYPRVVTVQKCIRIGDIEEVGDDTHLSFFEMLGNFSFKADYWKEEAIKWGIEFLKDELKIPFERIGFTYFSGDKLNSKDQESYEVFKKLGVPDKKIKPMGREDNFWGPTGDEGPCGPTVEIYIDGVEVWNHVFNEYYKTKDGKYKPLDVKGVDTGVGFERLLAVLGGVKSPYETDLFSDILAKISELSSKSNQTSQRIVADHLRAATFLLADGVVPSNLEKSYVLRRLIRRAVRHGRLLGIKESFCSEISEVVIEKFGDVYPELKKHQKFIFEELEKEENKFNKTIEQGLKIFEKRRLGGFGQIVFGGSQRGKKTEISGKEVFDLFQTHGFPLEMTKEIAKEKGFSVDENGFYKEYRKHQELSRISAEKKFKGGLASGGEMEMKYHTATHLLHAALKAVLGDRAKQAGSNITAERLRFDFTHPEKLMPQQISEVEDLVNAEIKKNQEVKVQELSVEEAKKAGAIGIFEQKYGEKVKVYSIGPSTNSTSSRQAGSGRPFSVEICGGPHVERTGVLGHFKITKEESSSAGVRRIKAVLE